MKRFLLLGLPALVLALGQMIPDPWTPADLMEPAQLVARLKGPGAARPLIFYVGFGVLYRSKHIPGSVYIGPGAKQEGLQALREAALRQPKTKEIIMYCGCCPWSHCPNVRPAFVMLHELGYKRVKILSLPTDFARDWLDKGYPFEAGY